MKHVLVTLAGLLLLGCRKADPPFQNYLRMRIDGVPVACDQHIDASSHTGPGRQKMTLSGYWSSPGRGNIELEDWNFDNTAGEKRLASPSMVTLLIKRGVNEDRYVALGSEVQLTISEVDERYVKGTFGFVARMNTGPGVFISKHVTDGEFHIKR